MTAVEYLVDELQKADYIPKDSLIMNYVINQAKEIEKQQIIEAHLNGQAEFDSGAFRKEIENNAEQYYNETFVNNGR